MVLLDFRKLIRWFTVMDIISEWATLLANLVGRLRGRKINLPQRLEDTKFHKELNLEILNKNRNIATDSQIIPI